MYNTGVTRHLLLSSGVCNHVLLLYRGGRPEKGGSFTFARFFSKASQKKPGKEKSFQGKSSPLSSLCLESAAVRQTACATVFQSF